MTRIDRPPTSERHAAPDLGTHPRAPTPLWVLAVVATIIGLSLGSGFFVPLILGAILAAVVHPIVSALRRIGVPVSLGSGLAVLVALAVIVLAVILLDAPVREMRNQIPKNLATARRRLGSLGIAVPGSNSASGGERRPAPSAERSPVRDSASSGGRPPSTAPTPARGSDSSAAGANRSAQSPATGQAVARVFGITATGLFALVEILLLAFFILAFGDEAWQKKIRRASRSSERGERILETIGEIRHVVMRYLFVNVLINAAQAALIALIVAFLGYPSPLLWGTLTFVAEFVPYLGGAAMIGLLLLAGLANGQGFAHATIAPGLYLLITTLQNNLVSPAAYGQSLKLNPTVILAGVMFWALVWGIAGVFLAVPLLAAMRIIAGKTETLTPFAEVLGE